MHFDHEHIAAPDRQTDRAKARQCKKNTKYAAPMEYNATTKPHKPRHAILGPPLYPYTPTGKAAQRDEKWP